MSAWKGKTVTIMGLGQFEHGSGLAAALYAMRQGADLVITDLKTEEQLAHQIKRLKDAMRDTGYTGNVRYVMGEHHEQDMTGVDMIIRNPGVPIHTPLLEKARAAGVPVESEMTLFFKNCPAKIVGITGTRGKSTTTSLIAHILQGGKQRLHWGGNIGKGSPLEFIGQVKKDDVVVLELSSWMLESLHEHQLSPQVAVLLNVQEDHLNRYDSMDSYAQAKSYIIQHQKPDDLAIVNHGNAYTKGMGGLSKARLIWFDRLQALPGGYWLDGLTIMRDASGKKEKFVDMSRLRLLGEHNQENALAAVACAAELGMTAGDIEDRLATFQPLAGRLQFVEQVRGVTFINDTTATTPDAAMAALKALQGRPIVMITGGADKGLHYDALGEMLPKHCRAIVWLPGTATEKYRQAVPASDMTQMTAASMAEAVQQAMRLAKTGDLVLLSPACASFGLFKNEFDRGAQFDAAVMTLSKQG